MPKCEHLNFNCEVDCIRLMKSDLDPTIVGYTAEIRIKCRECGLPFEFIGVEAGMSCEKPMASVDAQELRAPIRPKGCLLMPAIPGFAVRVN